jgi:hypothetical protein|tara:strand:- start:1534 stop:1737 length:204 start_codon:yes stop_codon:yes gene_type:complete
MKRFEHEVLTFAVSKPQDFEKMRDTLQEWGDAGYEVVSALQQTTAGATFTVFLKRETVGSGKAEDAA